MNFIADKIFKIFLKFKRFSHQSESCGDYGCDKCRSVHFHKILTAVKQGKPVSFILPAFPGKSPNLEKVLGVLPDLAEELSLNFLNSLCVKVKEFYSPGIKIIICSDGRVFSDVVGMKECDISTYQSQLLRIMKEEKYMDLSLVNLEDFYRNLNFTQMRNKLMQTYGKSLVDLRLRVKRGASEGASKSEIEANRMYCGMTRFLFEDSIYEGQVKSRSLLQREAREKAYEVIRRSNAWSELIKTKYSYAVRLSIHPQACGSEKLGIRLIANESWMTPWHCVAVQSKGKFSLMKKKTVEKLGGRLVKNYKGFESYYRLVEPKITKPLEAENVL